MDETTAINDFIASDEYAVKIDEAANHIAGILERFYLETTRDAAWREPLIRIMDKYFHRFWSSLKTADGRNLFASTVAGDVAAKLVNLGYDTTVENRPTSYTIDSVIVAKKPAP